MLLRIPLQEISTNLATDQLHNVSTVETSLTTAECWNVTEEKAQLYFFSIGDGVVEAKRFARDAFATVPPGDVEELVRVKSVDRRGKLSCVWDCFTVATAGGSKILFVKTPAVEAFNTEVKESLVSLLEFAEDVLSCESVVVLVEKCRGDVELAVKAFMYAGFRVLPPALSKCAPSFVTVGLSLG